MKRRQLFEFEDLEWWPSGWRDSLTDFLSHLLVSSRAYDPVIPRLHAAFERSGQTRFLDLCSGRGQTSMSVLEQVARASQRPVEITLSDKYPNPSGVATLDSQDRRYLPWPVDVFDVPPEFDGFRTIFTALHHFEPDQVIAIFVNAVESRAPVGVFEFTDRSALQLAMSMVSIPVLSLLLTPRMRPLDTRRLLWTYLLPVLPLMYTWDGVVSALRTYTPDELLELALAADPSGEFEWTVEKHEPRSGGPPFRVTSLLGLPHSPYLRRKVPDSSAKA